MSCFFHVSSCFTCIFTHFTHNSFKAWRDSNHGSWRDLKYPIPYPCFSKTRWFKWFSLSCYWFSTALKTWSMFKPYTRGSLSPHNGEIIPSTTGKKHFEYRIRTQGFARGNRDELKTNSLMHDALDFLSRSKFFVESLVEDPDASRLVLP